MADLVKFSALKDSQPLTYNGTQDLIAIAVVDNNSATGYSTMTTSPTRLAQHAVEEVTFSNLKTSANTVEGSINQTISNLANDYDASSTYDVDDCVLHEGNLYQCTTAITTAEAWNSAHWTQIKAVDVGAGGGGNADYVELTQLEYDALTPAQKTNGKMYFITDTNGDGSQFQPVIYSETEREIGVWLNGKPLYEKTVNFGALPNTTTKTVAHNISNAEHIWIHEGWAQNNVNGFTNMLSLATNTLNNQWYFGVDPTQIQCWTGSNRDVYDTCYVILHYTKSTDTAGSGTWTPQGVPAHHYSTSEQVVGTWIDGSTLYEKTVSLGSLPNNGTLNVAHNISNLGKVTSITGVAQRDTNFVVVFFPYHTNDNVDTIFVTVNQTNVNVVTYSDRSAFVGHVTIQYTKADT